MYKDVGMFIDKGDKSELYHSIRSKLNKETDLEYYVRTGKCPRRGCCSLCRNLETKEGCDTCTVDNLKFEVANIDEIKLRLKKEGNHGRI